LTAVRYFEELNSGYEGAAKKHRNRTRSAMFVQLMAAFEFAMKDFIAQTIDATHIYDDDVKDWDWLQIDVATVLSTREGLGRLGAVLVHPLLGWQRPETMNQRFQDVYERQPISKTEIPQLRDLWIVRHSVAHNGGMVTQPDARRLRNPALAEKQVLIDLPYLESTSDLLRSIVKRLADLVGPALMTRWFADGATGVWESDSDAYMRLANLTSCIEARTKSLPELDATDYEAAKQRFA